MAAVDQPVRPAIWAAVLAALLGAGRLIMQAVWLLIPSSMVDDVGPVIVVGALLAAVLGIVTFVLALVVTAKGGGLLRRGGIVLLVAWALGLSVSLSASGNVFDTTATASSAIHALEIVADLLQPVLLLVGAVLLLRGVAEVRRRREPAPPV